MHYGFSKKYFPLFINGQELKLTKSERDLCVIYTNNLSGKIRLAERGLANKMINALVGKIIYHIYIHIDSLISEVHASNKFKKT